MRRRRNRRNRRRCLRVADARTPPNFAASEPRLEPLPEIALTTDRRRSTRGGTPCGPHCVLHDDGRARQILAATTDSISAEGKGPAPVGRRSFAPRALLGKLRCQGACWKRRATHEDDYWTERLPCLGCCLPRLRVRLQHEASGKN